MFTPISHFVTAVMMAFTAPLLAAVPATDQAPFQSQAPQVGQVQMMQPQGGGDQPPQFGGQQDQGPNMMGQNYGNFGSPQQRDFQNIEGSQPQENQFSPRGFGGPQNQEQDRQFQGGGFRRPQQGFKGKASPQLQDNQFRPGKSGSSFGGPQIQGPNMVGQSKDGQDFFGGDGDTQPQDNSGNSSGDQSSDINSQQTEMSKQQEERQKQMGTQQLNMVKQQASGVEKGLNNLKDTVVKLEKAGVSIPADDASLITKLDDAVKTIKSATTMGDDVQTAMETIQENGQDLQDIGSKLSMLGQWPKMLANINKQIAKLRSTFEKAKAKAGKSGINTSGIQSKIEKAISAVESARDVASGEVKKSDTDFQDVMDNIRQDVFEPMQDIFSDIVILKNLSNITLELKKVDTKLKNFGLRAASLKRSGEDTTNLDNLLQQATDKRAEVKAIMGKTDFDPEELYQAISEGQTLLNSIIKEFAKLENKDNTQSGFTGQAL
ncbi:MAG: hypothetical protein HY226_01450 [Candidatus Vogelbacteria bacterium]|nr:hypothetical protein [Candidatus Vogelbacteria bacterium]